MLSIVILAQESNDVVTIQTKSGSFVVGQLISIDDSEIIIMTDDLGRISYQREDVRRLHQGVVTRKIITNSAEPFYLPTAIPSGRGNHHYKNIFLFGNNFNFGVTDYLDLSAGFELATLTIDGEALPTMQLGIKVAHPITDHLHVAGSSKVLISAYGVATIVTAPITLGGRRSNITLSPSFTYQPKERVDLFVSGGFAFDITRRSRLVTDLIFDGDFRIGTALIELSFNDGISILVGGVSSSEFALVPNFGMTVPFGKWKN